MADWRPSGLRPHPILVPVGGEQRVFSDRVPLDMWVVLDSDRRIMNLGEVGQPQEGDLRANHSIFDSDREVVLRHRAEYDTAKAHQETSEHGLAR